MSLLASVPGTVTLTGAEFDTLRALVHEVAGIALSPAKRTLLESRLQRRLRALALTSFSEYVEWLTRPGSPEVVEMINCVTTNKTDFYREPHHFRFLQQQVLPIVERRASSTRRLRIWSAGCSTGEEPYTIALALADALGPRLRDWDIRILASDIDTQVLATAEAGTYPEDRIAAVPAHLRERYFVPAAHQPAEVEVDERLRTLVTFRRINFADERWPINTTFDLIFCRNVVIYFDRDTQATLFERFAGLLRRDGHMVIGHSETLSWLSDTFVAVRGVPTVYRLARTGAHAPPSSPSAAAAPAPAEPDPGASRRLALPSRRLASPARKPGDHAHTDAPGPSPAARVRTVHVRPAAPLSHTHSITIGGVFASRTPAVVRTLLGSCVAACLFDPVARVGGMNHFLLPEGPLHEDACTRYGVHAMEVLINALMHRGADRRRLRAKAFGASAAIRHIRLSGEVQRRNAAFVRQFLEVEGIPLDKSSLGGALPLEVLFATDTGRAFVRELSLPSVDALARDEDRYGQALVHPRAPSEDVTLF
jgi:chemotaxis protein methyltransferase CheR